MSELDEETLFAQSMEKIHAGPDAEVKDEPKAEPKQEVAKPVESDTFDPATLSPSAKAQWDAVQKELETERRRAQESEKKYALLHGRVSPLQRELDRLQKQKQIPPRTAQAQPAKPEQPVSKETLAHWVKHAKDYPEESAAIEEFLRERLRDELGRFQPIPEDIAALRKELADLKEQQLQPLIRAREDELTTRAQSTVFEVHPDWNDHIQYKEVDGQVVVSHLSDALANWAEGQPARIVDMFGSSDPEECKWVMSYFKDSLKAANPPAQAPDEKVVQASKELENRKKNLAALVAPKAEGAPKVEAGNLDEEELFEARMKELRRNRR